MTDDFPTFLGAAGCLYVKANLCTPFRLREFAQAWMRDGISRSHCLEQIRGHLAKYSGQYRNGSGDWGLRWLDAEIRESWRRLNRPPRARPERTDRLYKRIDAHVPADDRDEWFADRMDSAPRTARSTSLETIDKAEAGPEVEPRDVPNGHADRGRASPSDASHRPHTTPLRPTCLKPIDKAIAFLLQELAHGEVAAAEVEANAKFEEIAVRTLDRARTRLKVVSRRRGFGRVGGFWLSLPAPVSAAKDASGSGKQR